MAYMNKSDLLFKDYSWRAREEFDNPQFRGIPDNILLDRNEGYEVLGFINQFARAQNWHADSAAAGRKIEKMLRELPSSIRSRKNVYDWIVNNWSRF